MSAPDRISLVLRAPHGQSLESVIAHAQAGAHVSIGRGLAVIASVSNTDLLVELGRERGDRQALADQCDLALGAPRHLVAQAQEMFDLLNRVNVKCGGLDAVLAHGSEPSKQMWDESREAMEAIWDLLDKIRGGAPAVDDSQVNQIAREGENVNQHQNQQQNIPETIPAQECDISERARLALDAARYRFLRDRQPKDIDDPDSELLVSMGNSYFTGGELDYEVDTALRLQRLEQREDEPCDR